MQINVLFGGHGHGREFGDAVAVTVVFEADPLGLVELEFRQAVFVVPGVGGHFVAGLDFCSAVAVCVIAEGCEGAIVFVE